MQPNRFIGRNVGRFTGRQSLPHRAWRGIGALLLVLALATVPLMPAQAAPARQDEPTPILLGQFANADLEAGQTAAYSLEMPIDGSYTLVYTGDDDPANFTAEITDADGNSAYSGTLEGDPVVDLTAGAYTAAFTAADAGQLVFVFAVEGGTMTDAYDKPGELANGFSLRRGHHRRHALRHPHHRRQPLPAARHRACGRRRRRRVQHVRLQRRRRVLLRLLRRREAADVLQRRRRIQPGSEPVRRGRFAPRQHLPERAGAYAALG